MLDKTMRCSLLFGSLAILALALPGGGCALTNVKHGSCSSDTQCAQTFGLGSTCSAGFCTPPTPCTGDAQCVKGFGLGSTCAAAVCTPPIACTTGHDCRKKAGGGACVSGVCQGTFPTDPTCAQFTEPPTLLSQPADGPDAPLVVGSILSYGRMSNVQLTDAMRLAVREINATGNLNKGQSIGMVFCDIGTAQGPVRTQNLGHALDYLSGTLGAPFVVGGLTSADAIDLITDLTKNNYPTVLISPAATSESLNTTPDKLHPTDPNGLFWRTCPSDNLQAQVLAATVIGKAMPAVTKLAIVYVSDTYGQGLATAFQTAYTGAVTLVPYMPTDPSTPAGLATIGANANMAGGDAVLMISEGATISLQIINAMGQTGTANKRFFFTDGSKNTTLLDTTQPAWVQAILTSAQGTAPGSLPGPNYDAFNANLMAAFGIAADATSFLTQAYDATYVGAYGVVYASANGPSYDGIDVANGIAQLSNPSGPPIRLGTLDWPMGKTDLSMPNGSVNIVGTSGPLDFDNATGTAPGAIEVWTVAAGLTGFTTVTVVPPP